MESQISRVKKLLRGLDTKAKKSLGQHFLVDTDVLEYILGAVELGSEDTVVEVGPGLGILTDELTKLAGRVFTIEVDPTLASNLPPRPNLTVINEDVLEVDLTGLLEGHSVYKVVANLPYYITQPTLRHFLEASFKPAVMVVMIQKEVAQNIVAKPGDMGLLSICIQLYGKPVIVRYVSSRAFYPQPEVDSAILRIDVYQQPAVNLKDVDSFFKVVRAGFGTKRKQLHNALAQGLGITSQTAVELLDKADIGHERRAQTLSLEEWSTLCNVVGEC